MSIEHILVATDFSDTAEMAVTLAMDTARHTGAKLTLVHSISIPAPDLHVPYSVSVPEAFGEQMAEIQRDAREKLNEVYEKLTGQGVELSHVFVDELPARGILDTASEVGCDLIVVGSHGRSGMKRILLGSVAEQVVKKAECDVLIARKPSAPGGYHKVLVPTDFSEVGELALESALELCAKDSKVDILHCWQLPGGPATYWGKMGPGLESSLQRGAADYGKGIIEKFQREGVNLTFHDKAAAPRYGIEEQVDEGDYDLVVLGTHGRRGLKKLLLGSVAESVFRHISTNVILVRNHEKEDDS